MNSSEAQDVANKTTKVAPTIPVKTKQTLKSDIYHELAIKVSSRKVRSTHCRITGESMDIIAKGCASNETNPNLAC